MTPYDLTPETLAALAALVARSSARIDWLITRVDSLILETARVADERDYAVAVADSLRAHNERLERELGEALRRLVDARSTFHGER
jgi:hypothetical protein